MTPDQIRQIAKEYAKYTCQAEVDTQQREIEECIEYDFAKPVIEFLAERYCMVERSKVLEEYQMQKHWETTFRHSQFNRANELFTTREIISMLELLFGSETFNKKEYD